MTVSTIYFTTFVLIIISYLMENLKTLHFWNKVYNYQLIILPEYSPLCFLVKISLTSRYNAKNKPQRHIWFTLGNNVSQISLKYTGIQQIRTCSCVIRPTQSILEISRCVAIKVKQYSVRSLLGQIRGYVTKSKIN